MQRQAACQMWIETVLGKQFPPDKSFAENLKSGVYLCELINKIKPGSVPKVYDGPMPFKQLVNVSEFLRGCQALGMPKDDCFNAKDLTEEKNMDNVVGCLEGLGGLCQAHAIRGIPVFGKNKYAKQNKRVWTDEQLRKQKQEDGGTLLTSGSHGTMERQQASKGGITFGNEVAGHGTGEATMLSQGSTGVMERQQATKGGITFGNEYAGHGSGEATMLNQGSTGVMERAAVVKGGITFGNEHAGHGSGEATLINQGSTGVMERQQVTKRGITFGNEQSGPGDTSTV